MPPTHTAATASHLLHADAALPAPGRAAPTSAPANTRINFCGLPITETASFPPAPASACWIYLTLNAEIALSALAGNSKLQRIVESPRARISIDSQWLWWALKRKHRTRALAKLSGSDLLFELARHNAATGARLLLVGSTAARNGAAVARLRAAHPNLAVAGYAPQTYDIDSSGEQHAVQRTLAAVRAWRADYVVLGLGPAKEQSLSWQLAPHLDGEARGLLCFGGAIDFASGAVRRAPRWCQRAGLEGLYRVLQQPGRWLRLLRVMAVIPRLVSGRY